MISNSASPRRIGAGTSTRTTAVRPPGHETDAKFPVDNSADRIGGGPCLVTDVKAGTEGRSWLAVAGSVVLAAVSASLAIVVAQAVFVASRHCLGCLRQEQPGVPSADRERPSRAHHAAS